MSDVAPPRVQLQLARLKLPRMAECADAVAQDAATHDWTYLESLGHPRSRLVASGMWP